MDVPILGEIEPRWSDRQRQQLAAALLILTPKGVSPRDLPGRIAELLLPPQLTNLLNNPGCGD